MVEMLHDKETVELYDKVSDELIEHLKHSTSNPGVGINILVLTLYKLVTRYKHRYNLDFVIKQIRIAFRNYSKNEESLH